MLKKFVSLRIAPYLIFAVVFVAVAYEVISDATRCNVATESFVLCARCASSQQEGRSHGTAMKHAVGCRMARSVGE